MPTPRVKTVNVVTLEHGQRFAERLFGGSDVEDACDETHVLTWPADDGDKDPSDDATEAFHALTHDICGRVYDAMKEQIAETFVRVANAAIDAERQRSKIPLMATKKKPTKKREPREDFNEAAFRFVQQATEDKSGGIAKKRHAAGVTRKPDRRGILLRKPKS